MSKKHYFEEANKLEYNHCPGFGSRFSVNPTKKMSIEVYGDGFAYGNYRNDVLDVVRGDVSVLLSRSFKKIESFEADDNFRTIPYIFFFVDRMHSLSVMIKAYPERGFVLRNKNHSAEDLIALLNYYFDNLKP